MKILGIISIIYGILVKCFDSATSFFAFWIVLGVLLYGFAILKDKPGFKIPLLIKVMVLVVLALSMMILLNIISKYSYRLEDGLDYVMVLGYATDDGVVNETSKLRMDAALDYLKQNDSICIVTGGTFHEGEITEAAVMSKYMIENGLDQSRIIEEDQALNTKENIQISKKLIPNGASVGIITSDYHLFRSLYIAEKEGLENFSGHAATSPLILQANNLVREVLAFVKYIIGF